MAFSSERARSPGPDAPCAPTSLRDMGDLGDSSADDRRHVRHAVHVVANVRTPDGPTRACKILDFCPGGLFLTIEGGNGNDSVPGDKNLERFDELTVEFSSEVNGTVKNFEVAVLVARIVAGGVGVSFDGKNGAAIHALNQILSSGHAAAPQRTAGAVGSAADNVANVADASSILGAFRRRVMVFLESNLAALFEHAKDSLFTSARNTQNREQQSAYFAAIQELDGLRDSVQAAFLDSMGALLEQPGTRRPGSEALVSETGTLDVALVDTSTFDDWVVIKDIISRVMPKYDERQRDIAERLSALLKTTIDDEMNPVGLSGLGLSFHDSIQNFGASHALREAVLHSFEETILSGLGTLYDDLRDILSNREVTSEIERRGSDATAESEVADSESSGQIGRAHV